MTKNLGFSFLEIMISLLIVGILAGIAYPSYLEYVKKSRRADAQKAVLYAATLQERYFLQNSHYTSDESLVGGDTSENGYYQIYIQGTGCDQDDANCSDYTITAQAIAGLSQANDNDCLEFSIDNYGRKSATSDHCWQK